MVIKLDHSILIKLKSLSIAKFDIQTIPGTPQCEYPSDPREQINQPPKYCLIPENNVNLPALMSDLPFKNTSYRINGLNTQTTSSI